LSKFKFPNAWLSPVGKVFCKNIVHEIETKLIKEKSLGARIFPENLYIFRALELVHFEDVKVMILGTGSIPWKRASQWTFFFCKQGMQDTTVLKKYFY
jgi:uracil DNA glycosylase